MTKFAWLLLNPWKNCINKINNYIANMMIIQIKEKNENKK